MHQAVHCADPIPPTLEELEARRLMSAGITFQDGILTVEGDAVMANAIKITLKGTNLTAALGRQKLAVAVAAVIAMKISGGARNDVVTLAATVIAPAYIDTGLGNDRITTGQGNDTVLAGAGNDTVTNRGGTDVIYGGDGNDRVKAKTTDTVYSGAGKDKVAGKPDVLVGDDPNVPMPPLPPAPPTQKNPDSEEQPPVIPPGETGDDGSGGDTGTGNDNSGNGQPPVVQPPVTPPATEPPPTNPPPTTGGNDNGTTQEPGGGGGGGGNTVTTPTYTVTLDVKDFGAVLDGVTDDSAAVKRAIDALPAGGLLLISGVAAIGRDGVVIDKRTDITIAGSYPGAGFKATAVTTVGVFDVTLIQVSYSTGITIRDLTIECGGLALGGISATHNAALTVSGNTVLNSNGLAAIGSAAGVGSKFLNNTVTDGSARGMWIGNAVPGDLEFSVTISGNKLTRTATAIAVMAVGGVVSNNVITDSFCTGIAVAGAPGAQSSGLVVSGNIITGCAWQGIQADSVSEEDLIGSTLVENNVIRRSGHSGIYVLRASNWIVRNNVVQDISTRGDWAGAGIMVGVATDIRIEGNDVSETRTGAERPLTTGIGIIENSSRVTVTGNHVRNYKAWGIDVWAAGGFIQTVSITENTCTGNGGGLRMGWENDVVFTDVTFADNTLTSNHTPLRDQRVH